MFSPNKTAARTLLLLAAFTVAAVPLTATVLRSRLRPVRSMKAYFLGGQLLSDSGVELQEGPADCGPAALRAVFALRGVAVTESTQPVNYGRTGWSPSQIVAASHEAGLDAKALQVPQDRIDALVLPAIALIGTHYVVLERRTPGGGVIVIDPDLGRMQAGSRYLTRDWTGHVVIFPQSPKESNLRFNASGPDRHLGRIVGEATTETI